jgi:hypothetical protein
MKSLDMHTKLINSYMELLKNLNSVSKRELIARLNDSITMHENQSKNTFSEAFGGWKGTDVAEDIIQTIRNSRQQNRTNEGL